MSSITSSEAAKAVVRRNTEEVRSMGNFDVFEELFADDFIDHTPQPGTTPNKAGVRKLYTYLRAAFPDFHAEIHRQLADGDRVTTYKTYHGTHEGPFLGVAPTHRRIHFETVEVMRVQNGKITDHWGVGNLLSLMQQIGGWISPAERETMNIIEFNHSDFQDGTCIQLNGLTGPWQITGGKGVRIILDWVARPLLEDLRTAPLH